MKKQDVYSRCFILIFYYANGAERIVLGSIFQNCIFAGITGFNPLRGCILIFIISEWQNKRNLHTFIFFNLLKILVVFQHKM